MPRPKYHINNDDWLDTLDWLDHQLSQPNWLMTPAHPIHQFGIAALKDCLDQWRDIERPTKDLCESVQDILTQSLDVDDWGRLRKSLSARKRRRREKRLEAKQVNITLTPSAHHILTEYRNLSSTKTLSEAIEHGLNSAIVQVQQNFERQRTKQILTELNVLKASELINLVKSYIELSVERRSLANACKIAHQLFLKRPDRDSLKLVRDRFVEDLVWNEVHLKMGYRDLDVVSSVLNRP